MMHYVGSDQSCAVQNWHSVQEGGTQEGLLSPW